MLDKRLVQCISLFVSVERNATADRAGKLALILELYRKLVYTVYRTHELSPKLHNVISNLSYS